jgi:anti-sigma B factor antagonist
MEFETRVLHLDGHVEIALRGELDIAGSSDVRAALLGLVDAGHANLVVDLSDLDLIDSTGISALVAARRAALGAGGEFSARHAKPAVRRVLAISGLVEHLNVSED